MAEKKAGDREEYKAGDFREGRKQTKYRNKSKSEYKDTKEASHLVSGQIAAAVLNDHRSPGAIPKDEKSAVKDLINSPENMRMVESDTNRSEHTRIDNALVRKAVSGEPLTRKEEGRARRQVELLQKNQDKLPKGTYQAFRNFYKGMKTESGGTVWDGRKDKHDKR